MQFVDYEWFTRLLNELFLSCYFFYSSDVSSSILHKIPGMYAIFYKEVIEQLNKAYKSI